jgi:hypothetical protein
MSVNPTVDTLIVALDFEGARDSSAQLGRVLMPLRIQAFIVLNDQRKKMHYLSCSILRYPIWSDKASCPTVVLA